ncbi:hypothetical protein FHT36_001269 [Xanthobacter sp. SG618]|uniref:hypothetical protein n=1 Tax=Xanthobacter sp. SG618 TaxID=2587121 RepID=UPI0017E669CF|nr:hypothetical protein [Xanthobacter sp. SG618]NMN57372.1 hypothetical protein [Xanthobacter sp. SG618]
MTPPTRRLFSLSLVAGSLLVLAGAASGAETTPLFKIVTVKDEIVVGLAPQDVTALGGSDVTAIGRVLKAKGEVTLWRYAVRKGADGALEQAPVARVSILGNDSLRVEPYTTPLKIIAPQ